MELSIILPAWNEAENLPPLVKELRAALEGVTTSYEIVVVDGGSRDGTADVARSLGCDVVLQKTPGYGGALREGFAAARGRYLCTLDADLSHPPTFIREMWRRRDEADLVVASRYIPGGAADMPRTREVLSKVLNRTFAELLTIPVADLSSGFRLYRREVLESFETTGRNFNVLQELLTGILARGGRIIEVPFHYRARIFGVSHARIIRFGISYLGSLWHLFFLRTSLFRGAMATRLLPYVLIIGLAVLATFSNAFRAGAVHWDDDWLVFQNPALRSLDAPALATMFDPRAPRTAFGAQYEPLADLSYAVDGQVFGWKDPRLFHIQGVLWHALAACVLFALLNAHARSSGLALVAALLFALHPATTEAVTWISGRRTAMSAALALAAALAWLRYRRGGGALPYAASLALAALACLAKQSGVATPAILALLDLTAREPVRGRRLAALLPHVALAAAFTALFFAVGRREGIVSPNPQKLESALLALAYYARLAVLPLWLRPSY
ncbi:MAG TPA: glycosyltransferase, partial [Planctomycetota bacterium]|nr:glycosyltransferase [Planctomycetota bacterium]